MLPRMLPRITLCLALCLTLCAAPASTARAADASTKPSTKPAAWTGHDLYRATLAYNRRTLGGAYERVGRRDPKWDAGARDLLEAAAQHFASGTLGDHYAPADVPAREALIALAKPLVEGGCDDPIVVYLYGAMLQDTQQAAAAAPHRPSCHR